MIYFITGNKGKVSEAKSILGEGKIEQLEIDLGEIQEIDAQKIIEAKLEEAKSHHNGEFIVEDTSLYLEAFDYKLPGPLIKWFLQAVGSSGVAELAEKLGKTKAIAKNLIGYLDSRGNIQYFEGVVNGKIVPPKGENNFGWDPIFVPDGFDKTFAEMTKDEKNQISHRRKSFEKFNKYLGSVKY